MNPTKTIRNLVPYALNIHLGKKKLFHIPKCDDKIELPRVVDHRIGSDSVFYLVSELETEIPVSCVSYGEIENLPEPEEDTIFIVGRMVLLTLARNGIFRGDLYCPGKVIRSTSREVVACEGLEQIYVENVRES